MNMDVMKKLITYAGIGQAAIWGMYISGFLIVLKLLGVGIANPMIGFILVPIAAIIYGFIALKAKMVIQNDD